KHSRATALEEAAAHTPHQVCEKHEGELPAFMLESVSFQVGKPLSEHYRAPSGKTALKVYKGNAFATRGWIVRNLTVRWSENACSKFMARHRDIARRRLMPMLLHYSIKDFLYAVAVTKKPHSGPELRPSVARVLQGSGSINEKLLDFVAQNEAQ